MHTLRHIFGKSLTERPWGGGYHALIVRPRQGRPGRGDAHEEARQALLTALAQVVRLRIVWDELSSLGARVDEWLTPGDGAREIEPGFHVACLMDHLEPGGWLVHGSVASASEVVLTRIVPPTDAVAAGVDVALAASFDSEAWELCASLTAMAALEKALAKRPAP
jgi:hypothetical protein